MAKSIPLTKEGKEKLEQELLDLKSRVRLEIAEKIYERHTILTKYLVSIGVSPEVASKDACKMEHVISAETFKAIKNKIV